MHGSRKSHKRPALKLPTLRCCGLRSPRSHASLPCVWPRSFGAPCTGMFDSTSDSSSERSVSVRESGSQTSRRASLSFARQFGEFGTDGLQGHKRLDQPGRREGDGRALDGNALLRSSTSELRHSVDRKLHVQLEAQSCSTADPGTTPSLVLACGPRVFGWRQTRRVQHRPCWAIVVGTRHDTRPVY